MSTHLKHTEALQQLQLACSNWLGQKLELYLVRLQDNLNRRASCLPPGPQSANLYKQQLAIATEAQTACEAVLKDFQLKLNGTLPYPLGSNPILDQLNLYWQEQFPEAPHALLVILRSLSPMAIIAHFPKLCETLNLELSHQNQAFNLYNLLIVKDLPSLYAVVRKQILSAQKSLPELSSWLNHTSEQLDQAPLNSQQRALGQLRLQRLQNRIEHLTHSQNKSVSDAVLLDVVANIFAKTQTTPQLPSKLRATLNNLQNQCSSVALTDRQQFMSPLHPARLCCQEVTTSCRLFERADEQSRQEFANDLRKTTTQLVAGELGFSQALPDIHRICQHLKNSAQLKEQREEEHQKGKDNILRLRGQVHSLIDQKTQHLKLAPEVTQLLYGPLTTMLIYFWSRHGSNSEPIQRYLKLADDIIAYTQTQREPSLLNQTKQLGSQIDKQLTEGFKHIQYDTLAAQTLINKLHELRYQASSDNHIKQPPC